MKNKSYYLMTRPETVVSLVTTGKLPSTLPGWAKVDSLFCSTDPRHCFSKNRRSWHEAFILELNIPPPVGQLYDFLMLESLQTEWIERILVYSVRSTKLLKRLFKEPCSKPIIIQADIYPGMLEEKEAVTGSKEEKKFEESPQKKARIQAPDYDYQPPEIVSRLTTEEEHLQALQSVFLHAKKTILITSFSIRQESLEKADLYRLFLDVRKRGVKVYIYYNDQRPIAQCVLKFFTDHKISCSEAYTHSKILAADGELAIAGSFNWLSAFNKQKTENNEGSLFVRGQAAVPLIEHFWEYLKCYRYRQFYNRRKSGQSRQLRRIGGKSNHETSIIYPLGEKTQLLYLPTLDQQLGFFQESISQAKKRLIICSPFISDVQCYEEDIPLLSLRRLVSRGVDVYFVCLPDTAGLGKFRTYLAQVNSPHIHLMTLPNIHLKTIIVDDDKIAEGSFNWLSAARDDRSDFHNHEQTLLVEGQGAKSLIEHFFQSRVGEAVQFEATVAPSAVSRTGLTEAGIFKRQPTFAPVLQPAPDPESSWWCVVS